MTKRRVPDMPLAPSPALSGNALLDGKGIDGREIILVDLHKVHQNPLGPRSIYHNSDVLQMADALKEQSQHDPIHIRPHPELAGEFMIVDGWTRTLATLQHGDKHELIAEVHRDLDDVGAAWYGFQQNEERNEHHDIDRAFFFKKLIESGAAKDQSEISKLAKIEKGNLVKYFAFIDLPEELLDIAKEFPEKISYNAAYQIKLLNEKSGIKKAIEITSKFVEEKQTFKWLIAQVQAADKKHEPRIRATVHMKFNNGGYFKNLDNKFEVKVVIPHDKQEMFAKEMESLLQKYTTK